jgi:hypothetical protein
LRLGRERFERVVSEQRSLECSCCLTKLGIWFNHTPPTLFIAGLRESRGPDFGLQNRGIPHFRGRISCMNDVNVRVGRRHIILTKMSRMRRRVRTGFRCAATCTELTPQLQNNAICLQIPSKVCFFLFFFTEVRGTCRKQFCLFWLPRAVDFRVSCSQIPRRAFAGIRTHDPCFLPVLKYLMYFLCDPLYDNSIHCRTTTRGVAFAPRKLHPSLEPCQGTPAELQ